MKLLNRKETAEILKCSTTKVIQLEDKGYLIPVKIPQTSDTPSKTDRTLVLYDLEDVERFITDSKDYSKADKLIEVSDMIHGEHLLKDSSGNYTEVNQIDLLRLLKAGKIDNLYLEIQGEKYPYLAGMKKLSELNGDDTNG